MNNNDKEDEEIEEKDELTKKLIISDEENVRASRISIHSGNMNITQELSIENLPENSNYYDKSVKVILLGDSNVGKSSIVNCLQQGINLQRKTLSLEHYNYIIKIDNIVIRMQIWDTVGQEKFNSITINYYKTTDVVIFAYAINDINSFNSIIHWDNELKEKGKANNDDNNIDDNDDNNKSKDEDYNDDNNKGKDEDYNDDNNEDKNDEKKDDDNIKNMKNNMMIKVLIGNKNDLEKERQVTYEQGQKLCKDRNFDFFEEICSDLKVNEIIDESSYYTNEEKNTNIKENNDEENGDDNKEEYNCVKKLFNRIGKMIYKQYLNNRSRINSSVYNYEASISVLEEKKEKNRNDKSCC